MYYATHVQQSLNAPAINNIPSDEDVPAGHHDVPLGEDMLLLLSLHYVLLLQTLQGKCM